MKLRAHHPMGPLWLGRKTQRGLYDYCGDKPVPTR
jgi:hypothetical protein